MYENVYTPFDLNDPVEAALFRELGSVVTDDRFELKEWGPHSWSVALLTTKIAIERGRPADQAVDYGVAAYIHDSGKFDPAIAHLFKLVRELTPQEKSLVDTHSYTGALMAREIYGENYDPRKIRLIITGNLTHHIDFSGGWLNAASASLLYERNEPKHLSGKEIPRIGRIIRVADSFDTMVRGRLYRKPKPVDVACAELREFSGSRYDPQIVEALIEKVLPKLIHRNKEELSKKIDLEYKSS